MSGPRSRRTTPAGALVRQTILYTGAVIVVPLIFFPRRLGFPAFDLNPTVGQRLELTQTDDKIILVTVTNVTETALTLDANHPLAGKELTFDMQLVGIM